MLWVNKNDTLHQVHKSIFETIGQYLIGEWIDYKDPNTTKDDSKYNFKVNLPDFPYLPANWDKEKPFTRSDYDKMSLDD